jgi:hypothetical protein
MMHFLFSLLGIKGLYMFRALLAHPQDASNKRHLVYCVHVTSVGCTWYIACVLRQLAALGILRACYVSWLHLVQCVCVMSVGCTWYIACVVCQLAAPGLKLALYIQLIKN